MKTYKDIYKLPLRKAKYGSWVYDSNSNFVFQFETKYDENGNYLFGWVDFENRILDCINGISPLVTQSDTVFTLNEGDIFIIQSGIKSHIITIRGWGNLTGIGAHNLSGDEAANIQDTFAEFIIKQLNNND